MITIHDIFELYDLDPSEIRLVRHGNREIPVRETFLSNISLFEVYQSFQRPNKLGNSTAIAVFAPYYSTTAIFLGLWDIVGHTDNSDFNEGTLSLLINHGLREIWYDDHAFYHLERNNTLDDLSERLIIEWGPAAVVWVQTRNKEVIEIKAKKSIGDFQSFSLVNLNFHDLKQLMEYPDTNLTWVNALSSVNGVYLIRDNSSGKMYVGSAYGNNGIYGRWSVYARNRHGGNHELIELDPENFQFSILGIMPATATADDVIHCENRWKDKLGTRQFGLNRN